MKYGCIGEKLGHSFSAEIHRQLFDYTYQLREIPREGFDRFMQEKDFCAINVTIPYKELVIPYLDEIDPVAQRIGAVNTVVNRDGRLYGYNTDFGGLCALIEKAGMTLKGKKVLVLGSGGTSKTAQAVAEHLECGCVFRVSRAGREGCITYEQAVADHADADFLINTTPCGMFPDLQTVAVDITAFPSLKGVVDVVYNPLRSRLVREAQEAGVSAVGGLYMLVAQAALAAQLFTGIPVSAEKIDSVYRRLLFSKRNLVLIGMPGCGKSAIGRHLSKMLGMEWIDTDKEIQAEAGKTIPEIFEQEGETAFREREAAVIRRVSARQHVIISTGGGAVLRRDNVENLRMNGRLYFIDRPIEYITATANRPLSSDREALQRRYEERYPVYCESCDCRIVSDNVMAHTITTIKEDFINEHTGD